MKIKSVSIEGLHNVKRKTYSFDGKATYLHGPNGAGKSTVLNAIQLALLGYIPGTAKNNSSVMLHSNCPEIRVSVELEKDDGSECVITRSIKRKGSSASQSLTVNDPDKGSIDDEDYVKSILGSFDLPIFDWAEFTGLTSNKMKDWFIQFIPGMNEDVDWRAELEKALPCRLIYDKEAVNATACRINDEIDKELSAVEQVSEANALLKQDLSYYKAALKERENTLNGLMDLDFGDKSADDVCNEIKDMDRELTDLKAAKSSKELSLKELTRDYKNRLHYEAEIERLQSAIPSYEEARKLEEEGKELQGVKKSALESVPSFEAEKESLTELIKNAEEAFIKLQVESKSLESVINSDGTCPYTTDPCDSIKILKTEYEEKCKRIKTDMETVGIQAEDLKSKLSNVQTSLMESKQKAAQAESRMTQIDQILSKRTEVMQKVQKIEDDALSFDRPYVTEDQIEGVKKEIGELSDKILVLNVQRNALEDKLNQSKAVERLTKEKYKLQERVDVFKSWVDLTGPNGLQSELSSGGFKSLEENLTKNLQRTFGSDVSCKFNVTSKANSFSFGIERGDQYIPYAVLSTGEKTLYAFALLNYISGSSGSSLKLVMMDDFFDHLDPERFKSLMSVVSESDDDVQIIMAGVAPCELDSVKTIEIGQR